MKTPDELRTLADDIRARQVRTDTAIITGRLDGADPNVIKAMAFLNGFEYALRVAAGDVASNTGDPVPDEILAVIVPLPLGKTIMSLEQVLGHPAFRGAASKMIPNVQQSWPVRSRPATTVGDCAICRAKNVEVTASWDNPTAFVCTDTGACHLTAGAS